MIENHTEPDPDTDAEWGPAGLTSANGIDERDQKSRDLPERSPDG